MPSIYSFNDDPIVLKGGAKADPQKIGEALEQITKSHHGLLKPKYVVDAARDPQSPLHKHFEWDDTKAADAYRIAQAREIIRLVRVETDAEQPVRAFLSISDKGRRYVPVADVLGSEHLQALVLKQADRDLAAFEKRYAELSDICADILEVRRKIKERMQATAAKSAVAAAAQ